MWGNVQVFAAFKANRDVEERLILLVDGGRVVVVYDDRNVIVDPRKQTVRLTVTDGGLKSPPLGGALVVLAMWAVREFVTRKGSLAKGTLDLGQEGVWEITAKPEFMNILNTFLTKLAPTAA